MRFSLLALLVPAVVALHFREQGAITEDAGSAVSVGVVGVPTGTDMASTLIRIQAIKNMESGRNTGTTATLDAKRDPPVDFSVGDFSNAVLQVTGYPVSVDVPQGCSPGGKASRVTGNDAGVARWFFDVSSTPGCSVGAFLKPDTPSVPNSTKDSLGACGD